MPKFWRRYYLILSLHSLPLWALMQTFFSCIESHVKHHRDTTFGRKQPHPHSPALFSLCYQLKIVIFQLTRQAASFASSLSRTCVLYRFDWKRKFYQRQKYLQTISVVFITRWIRYRDNKMLLFFSVGKCSKCKHKVRRDFPPKKVEHSSDCLQRSSLKHDLTRIVLCRNVEQICYLTNHHNHRSSSRHLFRVDGFSSSFFSAFIFHIRTVINGAV